MSYFKADDDIDLWYELNTELECWNADGDIKNMHNGDRIESLTWFVYGLLRKAMSGEFPQGAVPQSDDEIELDDESAVE